MMQGVDSSAPSVSEQGTFPVSLSLGTIEAKVSLPAQRIRVRSQKPPVAADLGDIVNGDNEVEMVALESSGSVISRNITKSVSRYLTEESGSFFRLETSPVIKSTVRLLKRLSIDSTDELMSLSLELWAATMCLVDKAIACTFRAEESPYSAESTTPIANQTATTNTSELLGRSQKFLSAQVRAANETHAATTLRTFLLRLDAKLQKPATEGKFPLYLACLLVLNCAERMCWLVKSYDILDSATAPSRAVDRDSSAKIQWPLKNIAPRALIEQGEDMAAVFELMLDMRGILPRPRASEAGKLVAPAGMGEDARGWFNEINLLPETVRQMRKGSYGDGKDCRSWDGRFWARTLISGGETGDGTSLTG
jgi:hypothetical protein